MKLENADSAVALVRRGFWMTFGAVLCVGAWWVAVREVGGWLE